MHERLDDTEPPGNDIDELRAIIVGPERQQIDALQEHVEDLQDRIDDLTRRAQDVGEVIPQALQRHAHDPAMAKALGPSLERAMTASVQRNPKPLADALFPIMGPAIRKAVSASIAAMLESLNKTLEHAFSRQSIQWRLEAWRTGKTFAEVVLLKTLLFRVEQVLLIDRKTGLLLQHAHSGAKGTPDADMVSGMLTAIRDFAQDSFRVSGEDSLESLKVGDLAVWIEAGPHAILAAVVRGSAPREFHHVLQGAVEQIHLEFGEALENFSGDASTLNGALPILEECLRAEYRQDQRSSRKESAWLVVAVLVVALLAWAGFSIRRSQREARYVNALRAEPGITVVSTSREGGKFVVSGLRDPLARDPQILVAGTGLDANDVAGRWSPYYSLDPAFVVARSIADVTKRIERRTVLFEKAAPTMALEQSGSLQQLVDDVKELDALAEGSAQRFRLTLRGHADTDGLPESNQPLSRARALAVHAALAQVVSQRIELVVIGSGSRQPAVLSQNEQDKQRNRRVTIQVERLGG